MRGAKGMRTLPAPENGDEIVAGPIEVANYFDNTWKILSACGARDARDLVLLI